MAAIPVLLIIDLLSPFKTIYPESQKIGTPTTKPVTLVANTERLAPTNFKIVSDITKVAPEACSVMPNAVPMTIIKARELMIFQKPSFIVRRISVKDNPPNKPVIIQAIDKEKKGCILYLVLKIMIISIPNSNANSTEPNDEVSILQYTTVCEK